MYDVALAATGALAHRSKAAGAAVFYLTGREEYMFEGTLAQLKRARYDAPYYSCGVFMSSLGIMCARKNYIFVDSFVRLIA